VESVLGVSMAPTTVRMVLVEGGNADGVTVDEENVQRPGAGDRATRSGPDEVISAILGTREGAAECGYQLRSIGVTFADHAEAAALRDALADRKIENVTLVSAFLAAAALAREVGNVTGYRRTGLLFVEPHAATLAVVDMADGSIVDVRRRFLSGPDMVAESVAMVSGPQGLQTRFDGLFVVGSGVDIAPIRPALEAATSLAISTPEAPETALARGAALASVHAPLFSSSTAALAYARDPGIGVIGPYGVASPAGVDFLAGAYPDFGADQRKLEHRPLWVFASAVAAILVVGVVALVIALAISTRPNVGTRSNPGPDLVAPTNPAPAANVPPPGAGAASPAPTVPAPAVRTPAPAPSAVPPVVSQMPIYHPPWPPVQPPSGERHGGGGGHGESGGHGEGGGHGGGGHGGGGGMPGY
jgi:uncharacterized membrane protein YgcG